MSTRRLTDDDLLRSHDLGSFARFYRGQVDDVVGYFMRRTGDPELAADLTAETFAAALAGRRRYRPERGSASAWLYGIAANQLASSRRRAAAEGRARRRLGMERLDLDDVDLARIDALGASSSARILVDALPEDQRTAITARVIRGREYRDVAAAAGTSEAVVRKRVSRGLAAVRDRIGPHP